MANFTLTLDQTWLSELDEDIEAGLTNIARGVAASARKNAPVSKRDQYASVRAVVAATSRSIPEDIDVTDYVVAAMKAQRDVVVSGAHGDRVVKSSVPITGVRSPSTITGRELGRNRPFRVPLDAVLKIEGRLVGTKVRKGDEREGQESLYPLEHAEITAGTKKNASRLVTGRHLKDSITVNVENVGDMTYKATILADRPYAYYVEKGFGPGKRTASYFMERALVEHEGDIKSGNIKR